MNKKSFKHFSWYDVFILYIPRLFHYQHISKIESHFSARARKNTKSGTWRDIGGNRTHELGSRLFRAFRFQSCTVQQDLIGSLQYLGAL